MNLGRLWLWFGFGALGLAACTSGSNGDTGTKTLKKIDSIELEKKAVLVVGTSGKSKRVKHTTLYSYVDGLGKIHMVGSPDQVPDQYSDRVVASDTGRKREDRVGSDKVLVLDLRKSQAGKPLNYSVLDLAAYSRFDKQAYAPARNPGQLGRRMAQKGIAELRFLVGLEQQDPADARVILYGAPWCGFCRKAEAYLKSKRISFAKRDIESSRDAAMELAQKLRMAGLRSGGIPVLDIKGTLVVGFDKRRIDSLLGL